MRRWVSHALCGTGAICTVISGFAIVAEAASGTGDPRAPSPVRLITYRHLDVTAFVVPPRTAGQPSPAVVYLQGRCGEAFHGCPYFAEGTEDFGWLVCPEAQVRCSSGGHSWGGSTADRASVMDVALSAVAEAGGKIDASLPGVLNGFSQGAYTAVDMLPKLGGRYQGLFLIGAEITTDAATLRRAGVLRTVLAAGAYDGARPAMERKARQLAMEGFAARFVSLGTVGHTYVPDRSDRVLRTTLLWLEGKGEAPDAD